MLHSSLLACPSVSLPPHTHLASLSTPLLPTQGVSLALSLHAPSQELRKDIVPSARAYPLPRLLGAVDEYQAITGQRVFVVRAALHH